MPEIKSDKLTVRGSVRVAVPQLRQAAYEHLAKCMVMSGIRPSDLDGNAVAWKVLITFARDSFDYAASPGAPLQDKTQTLKFICWLLVEIQRQSVIEGQEISGKDLVSKLPKTPRGRPKLGQVKAVAVKAPEPGEIIRRWNAVRSCKAPARMLRECVEPLIPKDSKSTLNTDYCKIVLNNNKVLDAQWWQGVLKEADDFGALSDTHVEQWLDEIFCKVLDYEPAKEAVRIEFLKLVPTAKDFDKQTCDDHRFVKSESEEGVTWSCPTCNKVAVPQSQVSS